jgi:hypothetical protein
MTWNHIIVDTFPNSNMFVIFLSGFVPYGLFVSKTS